MPGGLKQRVEREIRRIVEQEGGEGERAFPNALN